MSKLLKMGVAAVLATGLISAGAAFHWHRPTHSDQAGVRPMEAGREPLAVADPPNRSPTAIAIAAPPVQDQLPAPGGASATGRLANREAQARRRLEHRTPGRPKLCEFLRAPPLKIALVIAQKGLRANDPNLVCCPIVCVTGQGPVQLAVDELEALRQHLDPGGGTLFADAACGSAAFDASFRQLVAKLLPGCPLVRIPDDDPLLSTKVGFDLKDSEYNPAAGGGRGFPQLEGVELNDHWAIVYSKLDISCALDGRADRNCKGYTPASAARIAANVVIYSTLP